MPEPPDPIRRDFRAWAVALALAFAAPPEPAPFVDAVFPASTTRVRAVQTGFEVEPFASGFNPFVDTVFPVATACVRAVQTGFEVEPFGEGVSPFVDTVYPNVRAEVPSTAYSGQEVIPFTPEPPSGDNGNRFQNQTGGPIWLDPPDYNDADYDHLFEAPGVTVGASVPRIAAWGVQPEVAVTATLAAGQCEAHVPVTKVFVYVGDDDADPPG